MLRTRIAAAAVGALALGVSAALVPAVSNAETTAQTTAKASPVVTWKDASGDFTRVAADATIPLNENWYWAPLSGSGDQTKLGEVATLDEDGLSVSAGDAVGLVHGLSAPVAGSGVSALVSAASAKTTGSVTVGLAVQDEGDEAAQRSVIATDGLQGSATTWFDPTTGDTESTSELAADLTSDGAQVVGYVVYLGIDPETGIAPEPTPDESTEPSDGETTPPAEETAPADEETAPADDETPAEPTTPSTEPVQLLQSESSALAADASGSISALTIGDTTTYFTPQPTAAVKLLATSATITEATTTGIRVQGSGFAPGEVVTAGVGTTAAGTEIPGSLVADADGNVSGVVVLPAAFVVDPGTYTVTLIGASSGQTAAATVTVTADPAAVAVPVSGTATFTG